MMIAQANNAILSWITKHPAASRVLALLIVIAGLILVAAAPAHADTGDIGNPEDQLNDVTDSSGIPATNYTVLPFDRGDLLNWNKLSNSWWISSAWDFNFFFLKQCIWLFQWTLSFQWVDLVTAPAQLLSDGIVSVVSELNLIPLALTVAAIVCGLAIVRGKYASGFLNIFISVLFAIAVAAGGVLHNPVESVVGDNGAIHTAAQAGGELAVRITNDGSLPAGSSDISGMIDHSVSQQLVDIFLRTPTQIVAFGKVLQGDCATVFDNAMKNVKVGDSGDNSVREAVAACDPAADAFIKNPNGQLITLWVVAFAMICLFILAIAMVLLLFWTIIIAAYKAISLIWKGLAAIFPTANRASVWYTAFDVLTALAMVAVSLIFLSAWLRFVIMYMKGTAFMGVGQYVLVDALFIGGTILIIRIRKNLKASGKSMAERLTRLGLGNAKAPAERTPINPIQTAASIGRTISDLKTLADKRRPRTKTPAPVASPSMPGTPTPSAASTVDGGYFTATRPQTSNARPGAPRTPAPALSAGNGSTASTTSTGPTTPDAPSGVDRVRAYAASGSKTVLQIASIAPTPVAPAARAISAGVAAAETAKGAVQKGQQPPKSAPASNHTVSTPDGSQGRTAAPSSGSTPPRFVPDSSVRIVSSDVGPQTPARMTRTDRNEKLRADITSLRERAAKSEK